MRPRETTRGSAASVDARARVGDVGWVLELDALKDLLGDGRSLATLAVEPGPSLVAAEDEAYRRLLRISGGDPPRP